MSKRIIISESEKQQILKMHGLLNEAIQSPFKSRTEVQAFQNWMDEKHPNWVKNSVGKMVNLDKGYGWGNFGPNTQSAWQQWGNEYSKEKNITPNTNATTTNTTTAAATTTAGTTGASSTPTANTSDFPKEGETYLMKRSVDGKQYNVKINKKPSEKDVYAAINGPCNYDNKKLDGTGSLELNITKDQNGNISLSGNMEMGSFTLV
jgi:hypothetical protein